MRRVSSVILTVVVLLTGAACGQASNSTPANTPIAQTTTLPATPATARVLASRLWDEREAALSDLDPHQLAAIETGSAKAIDAAYIRGVQCGCEPRKDGHPLVRVIALVPHGHVGPFLAEMRTRNTTSNRRPWYVVAAVPTAGNQWKIAFVTFGGYQVAPPLHALTRTVGFTPALSLSDHHRFQRLAELAVHYENTHGKRTTVAASGATVSVHNTLQRADGVFGLHLPSGKELACFTAHHIGAVRLASGLYQSSSHSQWGPMLAPGAYSQINLDNAQTYCVAGSGKTSTPGKVWLQYETETIGVSGKLLTQ